MLIPLQIQYFDIYFGCHTFGQCKSIARLPFFVLKISNFNVQRRLMRYISEANDHANIRFKPKILQFYEKYYIHVDEPTVILYFSQKYWQRD